MCIRTGVIWMVMRAMCHHEVRGTCSQEEGSLQFRLILVRLIELYDLKFIHKYIYSNLNNQCGKFQNSNKK